MKQRDLKKFFSQNAYAKTSIVFDEKQKVRVLSKRRCWLALTFARTALKVILKVTGWNQFLERGTNCASFEKQSKALLPTFLIILICKYLPLWLDQKAKSNLLVHDRV